MGAVGGFVARLGLSMKLQGVYEGTGGDEADASSALPWNEVRQRILGRLN